MSPVWPPEKKAESPEMKAEAPEKKAEAGRRPCVRVCCPPPEKKAEVLRESSKQNPLNMCYEDFYKKFQEPL
ncbi:hypothetical protein LXL04_028366 [Taraxacum kok-saghyz]